MELSLSFVVVLLHPEPVVVTLRLLCALCANNDYGEKNEFTYNKETLLTFHLFITKLNEKHNQQVVILNTRFFL